jgi:hypothetical protein
MIAPARSRGDRRHCGGRTYAPALQSNSHYCACPGRRVGRQRCARRDGYSAIPAATEQELRTLYKKLIDAENAHDIDAVGRFVWKSPSALFVAKTKTPAEGNWAGFWGAENVIAHLGELYRGTFVMTPDYGREKVVLLSQDVAQTYVPLQISVGYAGQSGTPRPFLMIVEWVKDQGAWKMTTDIALPIPSAPPQ